MTEPTSWYTIEPGWEVRDRSGEAVGKVVAVVGDEDADIFDGLRFESGGEERFVEGARVGPIVEGCVSIEADVAELGAP